MKRYVILFFSILLGLSAKAQPQMNAIEFWYDDNFDARRTTVVNTVPALIVSDSLIASQLTSGMHRLSYRFRQDNGLWSSVQSTFFLVPINRGRITIPDIINYEFWFNDDFDARKKGVSAHRIRFFLWTA